MIDSCIKENISPIIIQKEEKGKYINYLATENSKEFTRWGLELQKKELDRIEKFYNKEKVQIKDLEKKTEEKVIKKNPWAKTKENEKDKGNER